MGVSARAMLDALVAGEQDPSTLADLARHRLRDKIPQLTAALTGRFTAHHALLVTSILDMIDQHTTTAAKLTAQIEVEMEPFRDLHTRVQTIPGIGPAIADVIIAETGGDMKRFPTAGHLASWAGLTPGHNESAGKHKSSRRRPGNTYLQGALGTVAMSAARRPETYLGARYRRIATRRGPMRANVAVQHTVLTTIWHMATTAQNYHDPGADYYKKRRPQHTKMRAVHDLQALGYHVTIEPITA